MNATHATAETAAAATVVGSVLGYLPSIAALFAIVWYAILIYDRFKKKPSGTEKS